MIRTKANEKTQTFHILVIEDEAHLARGIKFNLEAEGYRVTAVGNGPSALDLIEKSPTGIDMVILDLMLPGMSGYAVCKAIRSSHRGLPVLILSARALSEDRARAFDVGANQYLMKPFDLDELLSRVQNLLTYRQESKVDSLGTALPSSVQFGDAEIDFDTYQVEVRGKSLRMTRLEMSLLQYFVQHEGRVISRGELLENVWNMPGHLSTRAPDQFIRRLRKAFEQDPTHPRHFLTIRDAGYRFVAQVD